MHNAQENCGKCKSQERQARQPPVAQEQINLFFGFNPGPKDRETILSRLFAVEDAVYEILDVDDKENGRVREIAGSDMDLEQKVEVLLKLYPGRVES